jgi:hypothetical protein
MNEAVMLNEDYLKEVHARLQSLLWRTESSVEYSRSVLPVYRHQQSLLNSSDNPQKDREDAFKERIIEHELCIERGQEDATALRRDLERIASKLALMEEI